MKSLEGTGPKTRESAESPRLSPIMKYLPFGITTGPKFWVVTPRGNQDSWSGRPLMSISPFWAEMLSPGRPITRLMRSLTPGLKSLGGLVKTTMSPRCTLMEIVTELIDQHPVPDLEGRLHRPGGDEEGLDDEAADQDGGDDRHHQDGTPRWMATRRACVCPW